MDSFYKTLTRHDLKLTREPTATLQVNVGLLCNQACKHCHLEAGPARSEMMDGQTMDQVAAYAQRAGFTTVDITGGAPEMNPHLPRLIEQVSGVARRVMVRANLTALGLAEYRHLPEVFAQHRVVVVASLPATSASQADAQRGRGVFDQSMATLGRLNQLGYGRQGTGLELDLVVNPAGAFLPPGQEAAEKKFKADLERKHGLVFNQLFTFANVPLGRFRHWLEKTGNYQGYLQKLMSNFNPCAVDGLMCRNQVSVAWDGVLYDCDFNLAAGLPLMGRAIHVSEMAGPPEPGSPIATGEHCYTCTAGAGFT